MAMQEVGEGIWAVTAGSFPSNSYICKIDGHEQAVLIDTCLDGDAINTALNDLGLKPSHIFCTHGHFDHVGSTKRLQDQYGVEVHLHAADAKTVRTNNFLLMAIKRPERIELPEIRYVDDGFAINIGSSQLAYRHVPGHTPGSCVISLGDNLFTGDTLFSRGVGLSKLPGENHQLLRDSIIGIWDDLDKYHVHPGHGPSAFGPSIKNSNQALQSFLGLHENGFDPVWDGSDLKSAI